jgi:response regulator RpfG family c-di-GMP phosphodiesterase
MSGQKKILVVDDQITNIEMLRLRLQKAGYVVVEALRGDEAITISLEENPDLILLDIMMPEISGFEVCKKLTTQEQTRNIPVILVTALSSPEYVQKGFEVGAYDYVKKPYNNMELLMRVKSALKTSETNKLLKSIEEIDVIIDAVNSIHSEISDSVKKMLSQLKHIQSAYKGNKGLDELIKRLTELCGSISEKSGSETSHLIAKMKGIISNLHTERGNGSFRIN